MDSAHCSSVAGAQDTNVKSICVRIREQQQGKIVDRQQSRRGKWVERPRKYRQLFTRVSICLFDPSTRISEIGEGISRELQLEHVCNLIMGSCLCRTGEIDERRGEMGVRKSEGYFIFKTPSSWSDPEVIKNWWTR